jgi:hypothetical protein
MPAGRPFKVLDAHKIEQMAMVGCSNEEIALILGVSADIIERNYSGAIKEGKAKRNHNLRKMQYEAAKKGNIVMMVWLGKQWLNQRDRPELDGAIDPLRELVNEYRKRYDLLSRPPAESPREPSRKFITKKKVTKKVKEEATNARTED